MKILELNQYKSMRKALQYKLKLQIKNNYHVIYINQFKAMNNKLKYLIIQIKLIIKIILKIKFQI